MIPKVDDVQKRAYKRIPISLEAELINDDISYPSYLGNLSEYGLFIISTHTGISIDFTPGKQCELKLTLPSGETLKLYCNVMWSQSISPHHLTERMGIKIIDPSAKYKEFLKTLD
jgi:hypothetical protein